MSTEHRAFMRPTRLVTAVTLPLAPILQVASTLMWQDGRYGATGGTVLSFSVVLWITGLVGLLGLLGPRMPVFAACMVLLVVYGGVGGTNFAFQGFYEAAFGIDQDSSLETLASHPVQANLLLWWPGPLFPLGLFAIGVALWTSRMAPRWTAALLCLGAVTFPISRIPRIEAVALTADILLLVAAGSIGWRLLRSVARRPAPSRSTTS